MARHRDMESVLHRYMQEHPTQRECHIWTILLGERPSQQEQQSLYGIPRRARRQDRQECHFCDFLGQRSLQSRVPGIGSTGNADDGPKQEWRLREVRIRFGLRIEDGQERDIVTEEPARY
jgi:hypothetical protein